MGLRYWGRRKLTAAQKLAGRTIQALSSWAWRDIDSSVKSADIPAGLIVFFNSTTIPSGWTRFSAADDLFIVGAGDSYAADDTGGSDDISGSTSTDGAHTGDTYSSFARNSQGGSCGYMYSGANEAGDHSHSYSANYKPPHQNVVLIKADSAGADVPAGSVVLTVSNIAPSGLSQVFADAKFARAAADLLTGGGSLENFAVAAAGVHQHYSCSVYTNSGSVGCIGQRPSHESHAAGSVTVADAVKHRILRAWTKAVDFSMTTGMIALWQGATAPDGWKLCDGNGGTPDMRNYFVVFGDGNDTNSTSGDNTIDVSGTIGTDGVHQHTSSINRDNWSGSSKHDNEIGEHTHTISEADKAYVPPYYALTFIVPE